MWRRRRGVEVGWGGRVLTSEGWGEGVRKVQGDGEN